MKEEKKTEIKVGITVFTAILIFLFIFSWAKNITLNSDDKILKVNFSTVAGLEIGDLVTVNGVRKGYVESIKSHSNNALVEIKFTENVELKDDASFSIMMLDLMGGKKIEINSGQSQNSIDFNKTQIGKFSGDISTAMATLSSVEGDLIDLISELKITLNSTNKILNNNEFTENIISTVNEVKKLTANLNLLINENRFVIKETLRNTNEIANKTNHIISENSNNLSNILANLDSTLITSKNLISEITKITEETTKRRNNFGEILYDENLIEDLKTSMKQIKELTEIINSQLKSGGLEVKADVDLF